VTRRNPFAASRTRVVLGAITAACALVAALVGGHPAAAATSPEWVPKTPPLTTPWTGQVGPDNALPDYPRPQLTRDRWQTLNGVWQFAGAAESEAPPFGADLAERVLVPYPIESALSGIMRHEDHMWYRRTFTVPASWSVKQGQRLLLHFQAVDYDTKVWVNGTLVATHRGGYDSFSADVTDALTSTGPQELVVGVTDLTDKTWQPIGKQRIVPDRGIFYTSSSGIWQTVWMEPVAPAHIDALQTRPDIDDGTLVLTARTTGADGLTVQATAFDGNKAVGKVTGPVGGTLRVPVPNARLWSPDSPFLYSLRVRLLDGAKVVDQTGSYFGMREVGLAKGGDGKLHMTLNHKILFDMATLDQGFWPDGIYTAPTDEALRFDLEQHKVLGFNTIRKHIKVEPDRWYYWADKLGLMVWQDMPAMRTGGTPPPDAQQEFERQLHQIVDQHKSWTSITVWVPFNEGWGEWSRDATGRIADDVSIQDPSRLVNAHSGVNCCDSHGDSGRGNIIDYHQYVGPASPLPDATRAAVDGEHGGLGLEVPGHMWYSDGGAYEMEPNSTVLTQRYVEVQRDLLRNAQACGLSAGVYTQVTDVEHEVNGFFTYDRKVEKMDFNQVRSVNQAVIRSVDGNGTPGAPPNPGTPGLAGIDAYPFDEGSGTIAHDSVDGHDATLLNGVTWTSGHSGSAGQFNGSTQYADTGAALLDTTGSYSVAAWVKLDSLGGFATAVSQDANTNSAFYLQYSGADNRFAFSFAGVRALAPTPPETGRWYHLVGVRDAQAGTLTLYVDGQKAGTAGACLGEGSTGHTLIGRARFNSSPVDYWRGAIDQVHVYDRALSPAEVTELYTSNQ
jgi:hypothetical protein